MPHDPLMLALGAFCAAVRVEYHVPADALSVWTADGAGYRVECEHLDALVERNWLRLDDDRCEVTEAGRYQFGKWQKKNKVRPRY